MQTQVPPVSEMMDAFTEICELVQRAGDCGGRVTYDVRHGGLGSMLVWVIFLFTEGTYPCCETRSDFGLQGVVGW